MNAAYVGLGSWPPSVFRRRRDRCVALAGAFWVAMPVIGWSWAALASKWGRAGSMRAGISCACGALSGRCPHLRAVRADGGSRHLALRSRELGGGNLPSSRSMVLPDIRRGLVNSPSDRLVRDETRFAVARLRLSAESSPVRHRPRPAGTPASRPLPQSLARFAGPDPLHVAPPSWCCPRRLRSFVLAGRAGFGPFAPRRTRQTRRPSCRPRPPPERATGFALARCFGFRRLMASPAPLPQRSTWRRTSRGLRRWHRSPRPGRGPEGHT